METAHEAKIAQEPAARREDARLLVLDRATGEITHARVRDLPTYIAPGDLLVLNDTRVLPARLTARRATGGVVDIVLLETGERPRAILNARGHIEDGEDLDLGGGSRLRAIERRADRTWTVELVGDDAETIMARGGRAPLPPYIKRRRGNDQRDESDLERYQTVFAARPGAVAAPTAGLHFTEELLEKLRMNGIETAFVTLHVGPGTFLPIAGDPGSFRPEAEEFSFAAETAEAIRAARARGGRVVAVGTTSCRVLETVAPDLAAADGWTDLFIHPPHEFRAVDALLTNFHLPGTTLVSLVEAFAGEEPIRRAYDAARAEGYRFYSYGDCMLLL